jgi:hypothetical protein
MRGAPCGCLLQQACDAFLGQKLGYVRVHGLPPAVSADEDGRRQIWRASGSRMSVPGGARVIQADDPVSFAGLAGRRDRPAA